MLENRKLEKIYCDKMKICLHTINFLKRIINRGTALIDKNHLNRIASPVAPLRLGRYLILMIASASNFFAFLIKASR